MESIADCVSRACRRAASMGFGLFSTRPVSTFAGPRSGLEDVRGVLPRTTHRVGGNQRDHGDPHQAAHERVDHPVDATRAAGRDQGCHQDRRVAGLHREDRPLLSATPTHGDRHDQRDLPWAAAYLRHDQIADPDADGHAAHELDRPSQSCTEGQPERHDRRDRREERLRVADQCRRNPPGDTGSERALHDRQCGRAETLGRLPQFPTEVVPGGSDLLDAKFLCRTGIAILEQIEHRACSSASPIVFAALASTATQRRNPRLGSWL